MIVTKRYFISFRHGGGEHIIVTGERESLDSYIASKFGAMNITSSEELDGVPVVHPDLLKNEALESQMLNRVYYN